MRKTLPVLLAVVLLALAAVPSLRQTGAAQPPPAAAAVRWEYAHLYHSPREATEWIWKTGKDEFVGTRKDIYKALGSTSNRDPEPILLMDQAGVAGWEVISLRDDPGNFSVWFKRPAR